MEHIIYNGDIIKSSGFGLSPSNRSFLYGDGLFESIRIIGGVPVFTADHINRMLNGMKVLKLEFVNGRKPDFEELIKLLAAKNGISGGGYARITLYRGGGGKYLPETNSVDYIITVGVMPPEYQIQKEKLILGIYPEIKKPVNVFSAVKGNNAQLAVLASVFAKENGYGDVLVLNERGNIIEATSSNLFVAADDFVITPPLEEGPLPGIMRSKVVDILKDMGYAVLERCPGEEDLLSAGEVFLTNAVTGIKPVIGYRSKRYYKTLSLKVVNTLNNLVENLINLPPD